MRAASDPDDKAETAGASRGDAGCRIFEHHSANWSDAETARGFQKHVRRRLPAQTETVKINTINAHIEERRQATGPQDFCAMVAG
jgi:hypothetical protein